MENHQKSSLRTIGSMRKMQRKLGSELDFEKNKKEKCSGPKYLNCSQCDGGWSMVRLTSLAALGSFRRCLIIVLGRVGSWH